MYIFIVMALFLSAPISAAAHREWDFQSPKGILDYLSAGQDLTAFKTYVEQQLARNRLAYGDILGNLGKASLHIDDSNQQLNENIDRAYKIVNDAAAKKRKADEEELARRQREQDARVARIRAQEQARAAQAQAEGRRVRRSSRVAPAPVQEDQVSIGFTEKSDTQSSKSARSY